jgi:asparagine synthetase B (glutamine-hydrolysing)
MERSATAWTAVASTPPDGCYVLLRYDDDRLELVSDALASRTVWYAQTPRLFLASTSQRALISLLGDFQPDAAAVTWMATSGTLGPSASWDRRLKRLPGASSLTLDRRAWRVEVIREPVVFQASGRSDDELVGHLGDAILASCASLDLDLSRWILPLSGGMNSRGLLIAFLEAGLRPRCVTWGLTASLDDPKNDAFIARALAEKTGVEHR